MGNEKDSKTSTIPSQVDKVAMPVVCVMCSVEIDQNVWPKYVFDPESAQPLCVDCWEIEYKKVREDNEYNEEA